MILTVNEQTFKQEVLESKTPVLVNFWAPWCGVCRLINPMLTQLQTDLGGQVKIVSINADDNFKLANTYRLTTLPTVMLFDGGGVLHRMDHFRNREDIRLAAAELRQNVEAIAMSYSYPA